MPSPSSPLFRYHPLRMWAIVRAQAKACWISLRQSPRPLENFFVVVAVTMMFAIAVHVGLGMVHLELRLAGLDLSGPSLRAQIPDFPHQIRVQQFELGLAMVLVVIIIFLLCKAGWMAASTARQANRTLFEATIAETEARLAQRQPACVSPTEKNKKGKKISA